MCVHLYLESALGGRGAQASRTSRHQAVLAGLFSLFALALLACNRSPGNDDLLKAGYQSAASSYSGFAYATVDRAYSSSKIWFNDFATGLIGLLLSGESGDPLLQWQETELLVFNRDPQKSLSYYSFDPRSTPLIVGSQRATPGAKGYDPTAALALTNGSTLIANLNAHSLVILNRATGNLIATIDASNTAFDFGGSPGAVLQPVALHALATTSGTRILVLHQGLDSSYNPNGSQRLFLFEESANSIAAIDLDPATAGIQGIPLTLPNPQTIANFADDFGDTLLNSQDSVLVAGGCAIRHPCKDGGIERVDLANTTTEIVFDMSSTDLKGNGPVIAGADRTFYALTTDGSTSPKVSLIDLNTQTIATVHEFPADSAGCCAILYDRSANALIVGDRTHTGEGFFTIYDENVESPLTVSLAGNPYSLVLIPK